MTRFSIILPFHNSAQTLAETLDSLRAQTFENWELICIDDRSTDDSARIVADYARHDPRIRQLRSVGRGPSDARNFGALQARGDVVAFCDADDLWTAQKLASLNRVFSDPETDAAFGQIGFFTQTPSDCRTWSTVPARPLCIADLLAENPVCTMSNLSVRQKVFQSLGGLDALAVHNEDLEFLMRLLGEGYAITGINELQVWYRTSPTGLSSDLAAMQDGRARAVAVAARYGVRPTSRSEAVYLRYLARRALRLDGPRGTAWRYARAGLRVNPQGFLSPMRRGVPTALAAAVETALPSRVRRALFCN